MPVAMALAVVPAHAQATSGRTFVSGTGTDTGTCQRVSPCRSFQFAYNNTPTGGEVVALDPAGYGALSIGHAISIIGPPGGLATITVAANGTGVAINAAGSAVVLRGLDVAGSGSGTGIAITAVGSLVIDGAVVENFGTGLNQSGAATSIAISNTSFRNSTGRAITTAGAAVSVTDSTISGNGTARNSALLISSGSLAISRSLVVGNFNGITAVSGAAAFIKDCLVANNSNVGLDIEANSTLRVDSTTVTSNGYGVSNIGATIISYRDNNFVGNAPNTSGTITQMATN